jgi:hypothetical protein
MADKKVAVRLVAEGGKEVKAELEGIGKAGSKGMKDLALETDKASGKLKALSGSSATALRAIKSFAIGAAAALAPAAIFGGALQEAVKFETEMFKIQQVIKATNGVAGRSADQLREQARELARATLESTEGVLAAQRTLLTFRNVQGEIFDRTIKAAADMSAALGGDLNSATMQLAKALENPVTGLTALTRSGTVFTEEQKKMVKEMVEAGRIMDAQRFILSELEAQYGGTAVAAAQGLAGAQDGVAQSFQELKLAIADSFGLLKAATAANQALDQALQFLARNMDRVATYAMTFAGIMAARWVAAMAAAAIATASLSGALLFLRGALIRTGIGALIVAAGELVYWFTQLAKGAGGFGNAMILLWDVVSEVIGRIGSAFVGVGQVIASVWYDVQGAVGEAMQGALVAVVGFGNNAVNTFEGAYGAIKAIWGNLPAAIGDFAYQAANALIAGVEAMLNAVVSRINGFIGGLNAALDLLPDWATGGEPLAIGLLDPVALGRIENQFAGAAARAGQAAKEAFRAAFDDNAIEVPDLGLEDFARAARQTAEEFRDAYQNTFAGLTLPLESWEALRQAIVAAGEDGQAALAGAGEAGAALTDTLEDVTEEAAKAGAAGKKAGEDSAEGAKAAKSAWEEVSDALAAYAAEAMDKGKQIGSALVNAFKAAEDAFVEFVTTGKLDFKSLANSILADITRIAIRQAILGPLANALSGVFGGGGGGLLAGVFHSGGVVGQPSQMRAVPAMAFAGAPRYHNGGIAGLRSDEVPAILQRGERVLSRREVAAGGGYGQGRSVQVVMNINTPDANSFRLSQGQIMADARRALGRASRNS